MIDPDEDTPARLEVPPEPPPPAPGERLQRGVAVLIMAVTLLGALFAFLQTAAMNRTARATRRADTAAVEALSYLATASDRIAAEYRIWELAGEAGLIGASLAGTGDPEALALARSYQAAEQALLAFTDLALPGYQEAGLPDLPGFEQESLAPAYRAAEYQKAYALQRDGWAAKGAAFVVVITVLAVALFLIGLSRTPAAVSSAMVLVGAGSALALAATAWGLVVLARPVSPPSAEAIAAYVEGQVVYLSANAPADLERAEDAYSRAITARPEYSDAYFWRASVRGAEDFARPAGPEGSEEARDDLLRVTVLDPGNAVAWNNLAAAWFWLGDLEGAIQAIGTSLALDPGDLLANLNRAAFLLLAGDAAGYEAQIDVAAGLVTGGSVPELELRYLSAEAHRVLDTAEAYRPEYAASIPRLRADFEQVLGVDL